MKLGFIGLGRMGFNMAERLLNHKIEVVAYNRSPDKVKEIAKKGAIPAFAPKPMKMKEKLARRRGGEKWDELAASFVQLRVPSPRLSSERVKRKISPRNAKSIDPETMKTYFKAASMFSLAERIATSTAAQTVVSSTKIQKSARLSEKSATVAVTSRRLKAR